MSTQPQNSPGLLRSLDRYFDGRFSVTDCMVSLLLSTGGGWFWNSISFAAAVAVFVWLLAICALMLPTLHDVWNSLRGHQVNRRGDLIQFGVGFVLLIGIAILWFSYPGAMSEMANRTFSQRQVFAVLATVAQAAAVIFVLLSVASPKPKASGQSTQSANQSVQPLPNEEKTKYEREIGNLNSQLKVATEGRDLLQEQLAKAQQSPDVAQATRENIDLKSKQASLVRSLAAAQDDLKNQQLAADKLLRARAMAEEAYANAAAGVADQKDKSLSWKAYTIAIGVLEARRAVPVKTEAELKDWLLAYEQEKIAIANLSQVFSRTITISDPPQNREIKSFNTTLPEHNRALNRIDYNIEQLQSRMGADLRKHR